MAAVTVMAAVATCIMEDTVTAGAVTCTMVMVGQAMPITDPLMARVMVAPATDMRIMDMAGGITVTGTPAMAAGGVAVGTLMVLEPVGVLGQQQVGFGSVTSPHQFAPRRSPVRGRRGFFDFRRVGADAGACCVSILASEGQPDVGFATTSHGR
jgi:hypothetical protein